MSASPDFAIPLGPFDLTAALGRGGMGEVWAGTHRTQGVAVAVKVITDQVAREERYRTAFRNEVRAVAGLDHPGVVQVFDFGEVPPEAARASSGRLTEGSPYLVMEMLGGGSLRDRMRDLRWPEVRYILEDLLAALAHAHARGVVHRDLKPDNVLWGEDGSRLRLTDFGVAHAVDRETIDPHRSLETLGGTMGTPAYMAPEQVKGAWRDQGPWTDLYAVGCLAWELTTGKPPFRQRTPLATVMAQLNDPLPVFEPWLEVPRGLLGWLTRLLEKEPARRFRRAADALWALAQLADGGSAALLTAPPAPPPDDATMATPPPAEDFSTDATVEVSLPRARPEADAPSDTGGTPAEATVAGGPPDDMATAATWMPSSEWTPSPTFSTAGTIGDDETAALECPLLDEQPPPIPTTWRTGDGRVSTTRLLGVGLGLYDLRPLPFVGREAERDLLWQAVRRSAEAHRAQAVVLTGPAGFGKSRLASWLAERAHETGAAEILRALHAPMPGPGLGIGGMIGRHLRVAGLARPEVLARVRAELLRLGVNDDAEAQALTEVVSPATEAERGPGTVRFASLREMFVVVQRFLARLAARRPVLLWLDDVQWGRQAVELCAHLLATQADTPAPVLTVLTARDEALAEQPAEAERLLALVARDDTEKLDIGPLPPAQRPKLLEALLGLDDELARRLDWRTGGNPLFAIQLVGDWVRRGALVPGGRGFRVAPGRDVSELPESLHQVWAARVDRLLAGRPIQSGVALELAAVLGAEVDGDEWRSVCAIAGIATDWGLVEALLDESLAQTGGEGPQARWWYVHGMLRESLERRAREAGRREAHHRACAHMLRHRDGHGVAERVGLHLLAAGDLEAALEPLARAAAQRMEAGDYPAAADVLARREQAATQVDLPPDDPRWSEGWVLAARLARSRGDVTEAARWSAWAEAAARSHGWSAVLAQALIELGRLDNEQGRFAAAAARCTEAIELAATLGDGRLGATGREVLGMGMLTHGERLHDVEATLQAARAGYESVGDRAGAARCQWGLARLLLKSERLDEARRACRVARDLLAAAGARNGLAACANDLGELARKRGDLSAAERHYREAQHVWEAMGSANAVYAQANRGLVLLDRGDPAAAQPHLEAALGRFQARKQLAMAACLHACLLPCAADAGAWDEFDRHCGRAAELLRKTGLAEKDAGVNLQRAADRAREAGENERARAAYALAAEQWRALGRELELAVAEAALAALAS